MGIYAYAESFVGKRVVGYDPDTGATEPPGTCVYRVGSHDYEEEWEFAALLERFVADPNVHPVVGLVIGAWQYDDMIEDAGITEELVALVKQLPHLRALFVGDILQSECEISWVHQSDMAPVLNARPELEHFRVRCATGLRFTKLRHANLKSLTVESGGLFPEIINDILAAELPELEHLELWIGSNNYGAPTDFAVLDPLLDGKLFPKLRHLGLRNAEDADGVAAKVAGAKILDRIRVLDLSLGTLTDAGLDALLAKPGPLKSLERIDLHHHFLTNAGMERARSLGVPVDLGEQMQPYDGEYRYNVASE